MQKKAVITVIGKDQIGIISKVTTVLASYNISIRDISQTILQDYFTMMMIVEVKDTEKTENLKQALKVLEDNMHLSINMQYDDIFKAMHRI